MALNENEVIRYLKNQMIKNDLVSRSIHYCREYLKNWNDEEPDEYKHWFEDTETENLSIEYKSSSFVFDHTGLDYSYMITICDIFKNPGFRPLSYHLVTTLDGEIVDDYIS